MTTLPKRADALRIRRRDRLPLLWRPGWLRCRLMERWHGAER
jgi:hypothetical protein